jgi:hypothetical protein
MAPANRASELAWMRAARPSVAAPACLWSRAGYVRETVDVARAWSGYFQVSAFVSIYTINDTTMETKTPLSRARANPVPLHAPRPRFGRAVTSTGGVFRPPEKSNGRQRQQENGRKSDRRCLPHNQSPDAFEGKWLQPGQFLRGVLIGAGLVRMSPRSQPDSRLG